MIVDFHVHCFPDGLAAKAIAELKAKAGIPQWSDGTIAGIKNSMKKAGISHSVVLSIATRPKQTKKITEWAASIQDHEITAFGSVHPESAEWKEELTILKDLGIKGIKLHPEYQEFFVDDERMYPIYDAAFSLGFIIVLHAGADLGYPAPYHCTPQRLRKVVDAFPGGRFVAAHMGGFKFWDDVEKYLVGTETYIDTSFSLGFMGREQVLRIVSNHGYDKMLFATDSPWSSQTDEVAAFKRLGLSEKEESAILGGNAAGLLGLTC